MKRKILFLTYNLVEDIKKYEYEEVINKLTSIYKKWHIISDSSNISLCSENIFYISSNETDVVKRILEVLNNNDEKNNFLIICKKNISIEINELLNKDKYIIVSPYVNNLICNNFNYFDSINQLYNNYVLNQINEGKMYKLSDITKDNIPEKGVMLFLDYNEFSIVNPELPRIVYVGTHADRLNSKVTLWQRIKKHKGNERKIGNHRISILRSYVGSSFINKDNIKLLTWGKDSYASKKIMNDEEFMEIRVSEYINNLYVILIDINDDSSKDSNRVILKKKLVNLLSSYKSIYNYQSNNWLGKYCRNHDIVASGLWNSKYTND